MAVSSAPGRRRPSGRPPQSAGRHHTEWLNLVEQSGPFLGLTSLLRVFPAGLDADDTEQRRDVRLAYIEWRDDQGGLSPDPAIHTAWVRWVLANVLGFADFLLLADQAISPELSLDVPEQGERLRPTYVLTTPAGRPDAGKPRLLIQVEPSGRELFDPIPGHRWTASPAGRLGLLLQGTGVRLGLVTNGERWVLVNAAPSETVGYASWYSNLWVDEPITLRAFHSLLGQGRFFNAPDDETLEAMLAESASDQVEVTDQLGLQVRTAVEVLVRALDRADQDRHSELLAGLAAREVYHAGLTVMMRLVFLMSAEERGLFLLGESLYDLHYAVSTLRAQLRAAADRDGEEVLERRYDAWARLLATFRAAYGGVEHEALRLPAYGGSLFDPDRFPFLEGRLAGTSWQDTPAQPLKISNRTVLHLLEALQTLQVRVPGGGVEGRRLSFRALDVEQIGHVYEGLLDHTARRAERPLLVLQAAGGRSRKGAEPIVALDELEAAAATGEFALLSLLKERTGRSESALKKDLAPETDGPTQARLLQACGNNQQLRDRSLPFLGLLATTDDGYPAVVATGSLYVGAGMDRRGSGTHYTPRSLTEPIVRYALEPLVYHGPAEGLPAEQWTLRSPRELLELKVCDPAMGSGAFLVQACRYLSERLVEAWEIAEKRLLPSPSERGVGGEGIAPQITPYGELSDGSVADQPIPRETTERLALARRLVADRCLYGIDKNPTAVEMARLSLWLTTLDKDRPFTFLDHALKAGDSLVGIADLEQVRALHPKPGTNRTHALTADLTNEAVGEAVALREHLERMPTVSIADVQQKQDLLARAQARMSTVLLLGDLVTGAAVATAGKSERVQNEQLGLLTPVVLDALESPDLGGGSLVAHPRSDSADDPLAAVKQRATDLLLPCLGEDDPEHGPSPVPFHWPLEFPEVFARPNGGFDAIVGNPPFMGGQLITAELGRQYREYLVASIALGQSGSADLCSYFVLRVASLVRNQGNAGLIATNTISEGETRQVGLSQLGLYNVSIRNAETTRHWPGTASLVVSILWIIRGKWTGIRRIDGVVVPSISSALSRDNSSEEKPFRLSSNKRQCFKGSSLQGVGFLISPQKAMDIIEKDSRYADVLFPHLGGADVTGTPDSTPSRWGINFFDWPLSQAEQYPICLDIVRERVKPQRELAGTRNSIGAKRALYWWRYDAQARDLYDAISGLPHVWVVSETSKYAAIARQRSDINYGHKVIVFANASDAFFSVIESSIHSTWIRYYGGSLKTDISYSVADVFETFPFPESLERLEDIGERYFTHRQSSMTARQEGLTKTYNRVHNPDEHAEDIQRLRELRIEMDRAVADAYGWSELDLEHGFHQTAQGLRFTISEAARREVLERLLILNHARYEAEVAAGLHDKPTKGKGKGRPASQQSRAEAPARKRSAASGRREPAGQTLPLLGDDLT